MAKTILITGASSDIGQAVLMRLTRKGDRVLLLGRNSKKLDEIARVLQTKHVTGKVVQVDLSDTADTQRAAETINTQVQTVDTFIHAAGVYHDGEKAFANIPFQEYTTDDVLTSMNVGVTGAMLLCHGVLPLMSLISYLFPRTSK